MISVPLSAVKVIERLFWLERNAPSTGCSAAWALICLDSSFAKYWARLLCWPVPEPPRGLPIAATVSGWTRCNSIAS